MKGYTSSSLAGFSIIVAMGLVVVITLMVLVLLEAMVPFARGTKGIEESVAAYYIAESGIEEGILYVTENGVGDEDADPLSAASEDFGYVITAQGDMIPPAGEGESEFDTDWNTISPANPLQLEVGNASISDWNNVEFYFRVPDLDRDGSFVDQTLSGTTTPMIHWSISGGGDTMNATGSHVLAGDIDGTAINFASKTGIDLQKNTSFLSAFYATHCGGGVACSLKLSVIHPLELSSGDTTAPYLEYRIEIGNGDTIPLRFARVQGSGKSYGFKKDIQANIPQQTVIEALDFTIFQ